MKNPVRMPPVDSSRPVSRGEHARRFLTLFAVLFVLQLGVWAPWAHGGTITAGHVPLLPGGSWNLGLDELEDPTFADAVSIVFDFHTSGARVLMSNLGDDEGIEIEQTASSLVLRLRTSAGLETRTRTVSPGAHALVVNLTPVSLSFAVDGVGSGLDLISQPLIESDVGLSFGDGAGPAASLSDVAISSGAD